MALDLLKRSENGAPLSAPQHDANLTAIENAFNGISVSDRTAMAALNTATGGYAFLKEAGREGWFKWDSSDLSAQVTADTQQGIYVPPAAAPTGASGAWVRVYDGLPNAAWFGMSTSLADNAAALEAALAVSSKLSIPSGTFVFQTTIDIPSGTKIFGQFGPAATVFKADASMTTARLLQTSSFSAGTGSYASSDIVIDGITFDGNNRTLATDSFFLAFFSTDRLAIRNSIFTNNKYGLVAILGCRDVSLSSLVFSNWGKTIAASDAGDGLFLSGNPIGGDDTPTSRVRGDDLGFYNAEWVAIADFSNDSEFTNVNIESVKEAGVYTQNSAVDVTSSRHHYQNFNIAGVRRKNISASGFEVYGDRTTITNFNISDTDNSGIQINNGTTGLIISEGHMWDTVKQQASFGAYTNHGQIHVSQQSTAVRDITITGVTIGKPDLTPIALYALSFANSVTVGLHADNLNITGNNFTNGFLTAGIVDTNDVVDPASSNTAIYHNIGIADYANPFSEVAATGSLTRSQFVDGLDLTNAVENGTLAAGDKIWSYSPSFWSISDDPANSYNGAEFVAVNNSTDGVQHTFDSNLSAVQSGSSVYAEMWLKTSAAVTMTNCRVAILWYDRTGGFLSSSLGTNYTTAQTSYVLSSVSATAPANAVGFKIRALVQKTVGTVYVGALFATIKRDAAQVLKANSVTLTELAQMATASFLGRNTAGTGNVEVLPKATAKTLLDLAGTNTGDQNLFSTIAVSGQSDVVADSATDTLTLVAGTGISITTNSSTDSVTITNTASTASGLSRGAVEIYRSGAFF